MNQVVTVRLTQAQATQLERLARRYRWSVSEAASRLLEEKLHEMEYSAIEFRDSPKGRQAYVKGTSLAVWELAFLARYFDGDSRRLAQHLEWPMEKVTGALAYAESHRDEIQSAIEGVEGVTYARLQRILPWLQKFEP